MSVNELGIGHRRLIIRPGAIGDLILSLPAIEHLCVSFTEVWTASANLPLVRVGQAKRSIASAGLDRLGVLPAEDVMERLRRFDSIVSWYGTNRPEFRALVEEAELPFEFHSPIPVGNDVHATDFYCAQVGAPPGLAPRIDAGAVERHGAVILHPFASSPAKRWPGARDFDLDGMVRIRGPEEELAGALFIPDLWELARFIAGARAYVGNDSGITHLAAAVGVPTIALFGPTHPAVWGPRGPHVRILRAPGLDIPASAVMDALHDFGI